MRDDCSLNLLVFLFQDEILAEELRKSEYSESASGSVFSSPEPLSVREPESFSFPVEKKSVSESTSDSGNLSDEASGPSAAQLLLDPPLTDEEISADLSAIINEASGLDELDMMIQSAGPFQHPRSVAQNYAHSNGNVYHRQPSYHHHPHHHQVSERPNILRLSISMTISSNKLNFSIKCCLDWFVVRGSHDSFVGLMTTSGHSQVVFLTKSTWRDSSQQYPLPTLRRVPTFSIYLIWAVISIVCCHVFLLLPNMKKLVTQNHLSDRNLPHNTISAGASSGRCLQSRICIFIQYYLSETWLDHFVFSSSVARRFYLRSNAHIQFYLHISFHLRYSGSLFFVRSFCDADTHTHLLAEKRNENIFLSAVGTVPLFLVEREKEEFNEKYEKKNNLLMDFYWTLLFDAVCLVRCFYKQRKCHVNRHMPHAGERHLRWLTMQRNRPQVATIFRHMLWHTKKPNKLIYYSLNSSHSEHWLLRIFGVHSSGILCVWEQVVSILNALHRFNAFSNSFGCSLNRPIWLFY